MANSPVDRNREFMEENWGTSHLVTDHGWEEKVRLSEFQQNKQRMLREINNDGLTPKKHDLHIQRDLHEKIRNDDDYDDWDYGMEPITLNEF